MVCSYATYLFVNVDVSVAQRIAQLYAAMSFRDGAGQSLQLLVLSVEFIVQIEFFSVLRSRN